jgi:hypothetical protein
VLLEHLLCSKHNSNRQRQARFWQHVRDGSSVHSSSIDWLSTVTRLVLYVNKRLTLLG